MNVWAILGSAIVALFWYVVGYRLGYRIGCLDTIYEVEEPGHPSRKKAREVLASYGNGVREVPEKGDDGVKREEVKP
jgi:hypothetical protein